MWHLSEAGEAVRGDAGNMPKQIQPEYPFKARQLCKPLVSEWPIDQQPCRFVFTAVQSLWFHSVPDFEHRKFMKHRQSRIRNELAAAEVAQLFFAPKRVDNSITGLRTH